MSACVTSLPGAGPLLVAVEQAVSATMRSSERGVRREDVLMGVAAGPPERGEHGTASAQRSASGSETARAGSPRCLYHPGQQEPIVALAPHRLDRRRRHARLAR